MKKIKETVNRLQKDYPKSLSKFWPGCSEESGIHESNLTFQFVSAYLKEHPNTHAFFEVPFEDGDKNKILHYDAIIFDRHDLLIIEAKRLHSSGQAIAIRDDVKRIISGKIRGKFINGFEPKNCYGLILAEAWSKRVEEGLGNWWKGKGDMKEFKNWNDFCGNMEDWECHLSGPIVCSDKADDECSDNEKPESLYVLYGYKNLAKSKG